MSIPKVASEYGVLMNHIKTTTYLFIPAQANQASHALPFRICPSLRMGRTTKTWCYSASTVEQLTTLISSLFRMARLCPSRRLLIANTRTSPQMPAPFGDAPTTVRCTLPTAYTPVPRLISPSSVAVFDVVKTHDRTQPFVLLQPRISLQDLLPNFDLVSAAKQDRLPNIEAAYVGMVEETGSLFAMSPDRYPLVVFGDTNFEEEYPRGSRPSIDPPSNFVLDGRDFPSDVDSITRVMKRRKLKEACRNGSKDKRCLTGVRRLESSRLSRLLDGPASVPFPPHMADPRDHPNHSASLPGAGNASIQPHPGAGAHLVEDSSRGYANLSAQALSTYTVGLLTLLAMFVWMFKRFERRPTPPPAQTPPMHVDVSVVEATLMTPDQTTPTSETTESTLVEKPSPRIKQEDDGGAETPRPKGRAVSFGEAVKIATVTPEDDDEAGENAEGEESDADQAQTPGRRKPARRKRGKKKPKPGPLNGSGENGKLEGQDSKPAVQDSVPEEPQTPKANGSPEAVHVVSPSSIVVPPPSPAVPVIPSLVVSDTILGMSDVSYMLRIVC